MRVPETQLAFIGTYNDPSYSAQHVPLISERWRLEKQKDFA